MIKIMLHTIQHNNLSVLCTVNTKTGENDIFFPVFNLSIGLLLYSFFRNKIIFKSNLK